MDQGCPNCGVGNPLQARFCMSCGTALAPHCANCGTELPAEAKFCFSCGAAVEGAPATPATAPAAPAPPSAPTPEAPPEERRHVTVLFADLSGYTKIAEGMDPEAVKGLVARCLEHLAGVVTEHGGTVDKFIGDNVMALFGAPVAHEDDAERAVRAGLAMQEAMPELNRLYTSAHGAEFKLRVGINTGEVLAGIVGDRYTVTGDTVNVASRLQSAAEPGSVTVGERTATATADAVTYRELAPLSLKGKAEPVRAWEAVGLSEALPIRRRPSAQRTPFVGRDREIDLLESMYERVTREGRSQLVTLIGQAGVGKSRLLEELRDQLCAHSTKPALHTGHCLPYGSGIVFWALGEVLRAEFEIVETDSAEVAWRKLRSGVAGLLDGGDEDAAADRRAALIGRLLGIESPLGPPAEEEDPERMREAYFSAIRGVVEAMAQRKPLVLAFEDIHWADEGMLDLIEYVAQWVRGPMLVVCMARDELLERRPTWGSGQRNASTLALDPLAEEPARELVATLLGGSAKVEAEIVSAIVGRAGGNPFFAEEMARRIESSGGAALELPETVHGLLTARLDSLEAAERRLLQQASVVGQTFSLGLLAGLESSDEEGIRSLVHSLERKDLLVPASVGRSDGEEDVAFKHVLIRDVAYSTLPKGVRCRRHFEVGRLLERRAGDRTEEVVALLAEHFGRAAALGDEVGLDAVELAPMIEKAFAYLEAAGDAAAAIYSNLEAFEDYEAAGRLGIEDRAAVARVAEKQGDVGLRLGRADAAVELWSECLEHYRFEEDLKRVGDLHRKVGAGLWHRGESKEAIQHYQRGINLLKDGPPCLELVRLYEEAAALYMRTGDNMLAIYAAEKALRLAERLEQRLAAGRAHGIFGRVFGRIGDAEQARSNLERSVELAREESPAETIRALLTLGEYLEMSQADYPAAEETYNEALGIARRLGDLPAQVEINAALAVLAVYGADWALARELAEESADLAQREGLVGKLAYPVAVRGLLAWREGRGDEAESNLRRAHEMAEDVGWSEVSFVSLVFMAIALRDRNELTAAVGSLDSALDVCERAGLIAQSIQAMALRAELLMLDGRAEQAAEAADEAARMAERLPYPIGQAAALEARGITAPDPAEAAELLRGAQQRWEDIGRPLDASRCVLILGRRLATDDPEGSRTALSEAAERFGTLGVQHLSEQARTLAPAGA